MEVSSNSTNMVIFWVTEPEDNKIKEMPYEYVTTRPARCHELYGHEIFRLEPFLCITDWLKWLHWIKQQIT